MESEKNFTIPENYQLLEGSKRLPRIGAQITGSADPNEKFLVSILIRRRADAPELPDMEYWAKTPPGRRKFISREEYAVKYGADEADMDKVIAFANSNSLMVVETSIARRTIVVSGTVNQISQAFAVKLSTYTTPTETYRGRDGYVYLPKDIVAIVKGVFGLDNRKMAEKHGPPAGSAGLVTTQVATLYDFPTTLATGQTIGIIEFGGGFLQQDIESFFTNIELSAYTPTPVIVPIDGSDNNPSVPLATDPNAATNDGEVTCDIDVAGSIAKGAGIALYFAPGTQQGWVDAVTTAIHDAVNKPSVLSISWGYPEEAGTIWTTAAFKAVNEAFMEAAALGVTIFAASGDDGVRDMTTDGNAHADFPSTSPWVTGCGGTLITYAYESPFKEGTWNDNFGATGGGISDIFERPSWQMDINMPDTLNTSPVLPLGGGRGVPDIAGNASAYSGYTYYLSYWNGNQAQDAAGTSVVAPLYAGLIALLNATLSEPIGYLNPTLYAIAKTAGQTVFRDINDGGNNSVTASGPYPKVTGYNSAAGWDPCTGLGVLDGNALLTSINKGLSQDCYIVLDWEKFVKAGVDEMVNATPPVPAVYQYAFYVVADGFTPAELRAGTANPVVPAISFSPVTQGMSCKLTAGPLPDGTPGTPDAPQRWTFTYEVIFTNDNDFPMAPGSASFTITATINTAVSSSAVIELINQTAPYMTAGPITWLSNDIRVFQIQPGGGIPGLPTVTMGNAVDSSGNVDIQANATTFIQELIKGFEGVASDPFDPIPPDETASMLDTSATTGPPADPIPVYNFAVARVRYSDPDTDAENVRVFFRTFPAASISVAYDQSSTYRRYPDNPTESGNCIPLLGMTTVSGTQYDTIPFFAAPRVDSTAVSMTTQTDAPNVQTILHDSTVPVVYAFYGCWLDINQPAESIFPTTLTLDDDGPFTGTAANPLTSVLGLINNNHQCIITEIAYDPVPIPEGATPSSSTMLNQRNLVLGTVANPGKDAASRRVSNTFQMRPTAEHIREEEMPDEMMIDWGNLPAGSTATLYLPGVDTKKIIERSHKLYGYTKLTETEEYTLQFPARGISYLPIPKHEGKRLFALLSVELPLGIVKGQSFQVIVRQLTGKVRIEDGYHHYKKGWRTTLGTFQITINVQKKEEMLKPEEGLLSIFRLIKKGASKKGAWYPLLKKYTEHIAYRVNALGGKAASIKPYVPVIFHGPKKR